MKPPDFEYQRPTTIQAAVRLLSDADGEAKVLAGGQSLVPLMNFRLASPRLLVDLNGVPALSFLEVKDGTLRVGAMTRTRALELDPLVREAVPLLARAAPWIGHVQIRNRGTVGGSVAHADPAAELPALCVLLDAELIAVGPAGERPIAATGFFLDFLTTSLAEDEILMELRFPVHEPDQCWGFAEYAQRRGDFALAGAAVSVTVTGGIVRRSRVVIFGTPDRPVIAQGAEAVLAGSALTDSTIAEAGRQAATALENDPRADSEYRRRLTETLVSRALKDAANGPAQGWTSGRAEPPR